MEIASGAGSLMWKLILAAAQDPAEERQSPQEVQSYLCHWQQPEQQVHQVLQVGKELLVMFGIAYCNSSSKQLPGCS